jgi:hypothetical protein
MSVAKIFGAALWQNAVAALIALSFIDANIRLDGAAHRLWHESPESLMLYLSIGVGMKMAKDVGSKAVEMKYKGTGSVRIDNPDGE